MNNRLILHPFFSALCILFLASATRTAFADPLLVVPARHTILQIAFDMRDIRSATLLTYQRPGAGKDLLMHVWNKELGQWLELPADSYEVGSFFEMMPDRVIVVSAGPAPETLTRPEWCVEAVYVESLDIARLVNKLDEELNFTKREWKWLQRRYDLEIKDRNETRRRWGRYGPPGGRPTRAREMDRSTEEILAPPESFEAPTEMAEPQMKEMAPEDK